MEIFIRISCTRRRALRNIVKNTSTQKTCINAKESQNINTSTRDPGPVLNVLTKILKSDPDMTLSIKLKFRFLIEFLLLQVPQLSRLKAATIKARVWTCSDC